MLDLNQIMTQVPINVYVVIGCCVVGWVMKKFLPTDNKIIPLVLTVLGTVLFVLIEGLGVQNAIAGAFTGAAATGLHQIFAQYIEGRELACTNGDGAKAQDFEADPQEDTVEGSEES